MTERQVAEPACRRAASGSLLALALVLITLLSSLSTAPMANAVVAPTKATATTATTAAAPVGPIVTPSTALTVTLTAITPTIAVPNAPITITGTARNSGSVPITSPFARAFLGRLPLTSRQAVADWAWATTPDERSLTEVARISLGKTLPPRTTAKFVLTIPADATSRPDSFAVLPLRIDVVGTTRGEADTQERAALSTFLPALSAVKAFEPLSIAWLVPLTLDPDPALHGVDSPARTAAWNKAIGPGSRLDRLIEGTENANVTWAIDPAILGPQQTPTAVDAAGPNPTSTPTNTPVPGSTAPPDPVFERTTALVNRLRAAAPLHTLWSLPYSDPDFAAILPLASGNPSLEPVVSPSDTLNAAVVPARADIAWPVEGTVTPESQAQLARAFAAPGLAGSVTSASTLTSRAGSVGGASHKTSGGLPLLAYDEALSRTVAQTSSRQAGTLTVQQFLADSLALLGEWPGTRDRSVLIAAPRTFDGDPAVLRSLFAAVAEAPWLTTTTTDRILEASQEMDPEVLGLDLTPQSPPGTTPSAPTGGDSPTAADPFTPGTSPLTLNQLRTMPQTQSAITGIASILDDGQLYGMRWTDAQDQLVSTRWRGHHEGFTAVRTATSTAIRSVSRSVSVAPSSVNFFADQGVLQVTVVNALGVAIHDVHLRLTPAQPRLRIAQQPGPLRIGAKGRASVPLQVTAIAAGLVQIEAVLTTSNGTPLGQSARVNVRVYPTSTWIYWVLGGLAGLVLILGTYRSLRLGSTRAYRPEAQRIAIDD